ncbi:MAG: hypothetical protein KDA37_02275, partial [Planctomycetales bacterium]|nr:hypothetical protein [Planctomycetales bacterium]
IADELNVKRVEFSDKPELYVDHQVMPNFRALGKKLGKLVQKVKFVLDQASGSELLENLRDNGMINLEVEGQQVELSPEEVEIRITPKPGWAAANDQGVVVVLSTELTPELIAEGLARDLIRVIQDRRKEIGCEFTDRIEIGLATESDELRQAVDSFGDYVARETLADSLTIGALGGVDAVDVKLGDDTAQLYLKRIG